jgi:ribosomal protein L11 methyltransferase
MSRKSGWTEIRVNADPMLLEELSVPFFDMGCQGIDEQQNGFTVYFKKEHWTDATKMIFSSLLENKDITADKITYQTLEEENWNENWKEYFKTFRLGKNIIIKPDWEVYEAEDEEKVVTIIPKMAFGTGHHETTRLILKQLEETVRPGMSVLDAGCGTAILAIYCAVMGAGKITAFDVDAVAVENARENIMLNQVADRICLRCATLQDINKEAYDLITANINRNVLLDLAAPFNAYTRPGTILLLSGLLHEDKDAVLQQYNREGWILEKSEQRAEWLSLRLIKS